MADDFGFQPSTPDNFGFQPLPKAPNTSGVQKMAQQNLAANDNKDSADGASSPATPQTPMQRYSTAAGLPVEKVINGTATPSDIDYNGRKEYVKALNNGSAESGSDWLPTALHAIAPVVSDVTKTAGSQLAKGEEYLLTSTPGSLGSDIVQNTINLPVQGATRLAGAAYEAMGGELSPKVAESLTQGIPEFGQNEGSKTIRSGLNAMTDYQPITAAGKVTQGTLGIAPYLLGGEASLTQKAAGALASGAGSTAATETAKALGLGEKGQQAANIIGGAPGMLYGAAPGVWDDHPGSEPIKEAVAAKTGKEPSAVSSPEIDQTIAEGGKQLFPHNKDFKDVSTVTGIPELELKNNYVQTGVTPEKVFTDSQANPQIAEDIANGKTPEAYEHLAVKPQLPPETAEKLQVSRSDTSKTFNVVDAEGDHVQGGFDSYEEAKQFIEDKKQEPIGDEPPEWATRTNEPVTEKTQVGEQSVIPGAERISDRELAERKMEPPLRGGNAPMEGGLFDVTGRGQGDIFEQPSHANDSAKEAQAKMAELEKIHDNPDTSPEEKAAIIQQMNELEKTASKSSEKVENEFSDINKKVDGMSAEARTQRLKSLNKKTEAGIATVKEMAEREALSAKVSYDISHDRLSLVTSPKTGLGELPKGNENTETGNAGSKGSLGVSDKNIEGKRQGVIPPSEIGKPTSLKTFLKNNGGKIDETNQLISMKDEKGNINERDLGLDRATQLAHEAGYFPERPSIRDLQDKLLDTAGGKEHFRDQDYSRVDKMRETETAKKLQDPSYLEHEANSVGLDTERLKEETDKQYTKRLLKALTDFYKEQGGTAPVDIYRKIIGDTIIAAEKFVGKLTGDLFQRLGQGYAKTFAPELIGDAALRADAYMAKFKASHQEAENSYYRQSAASKAAFDKLTDDERMEWLYDHETGRWNEIDNPDHARYEALYDAMFKAEKEAIGADADKGYKENYLPHQLEDPEAVKNYFQSEAMIKKYGADWFTKTSTFKLIQEGVRAGFKLKTNNPESMLVARQLASHNMIATMNLLHDMEGSGIAAPTRLFSVDKRIAKTQDAIKDLETKYKAASDKINDPKQLRWDFADPAVSKYMKTIEGRLDTLKTRLADFNKEKADTKLTPAQMAELKKNGFKVIGPDSKAWSIHQQVAPLWKNAMESKGLWENQGVIGDAYRFYTGSKAIWTAAKLGLSLFHPVHVAMINLASGISHIADHLIQGGSFSDLALKDTGVTLGLTKGTFKGKDHPAVQAWNTTPEARTPEQQHIVQTMVEGGFKPTMSARDTIHFKENFDKAIDGVGMNNLRLLGTAIQLPGKIMAPFFEHWIPGMKSEIYLRRAEDAIKRDPTLAQDAGRRGEVLRQIAKDTDRTYGEMNNDVQFWNKAVRDSFNAAFISGGWKLAQIYNARGLLQPAKIAYKFAKTGEFSKDDVTYNMLHAYAYTGLTLALGGAINAMLGNPIGTAKDTVWDMVKNLVAPQTGEKNPDGTPIRLNQPAFAKEGYALAHDINTKGLIGGTGEFLYHQTLIPGIVDTLNNRDFTGREIISDPTDLHQWANAGWDAINPISIGGYEKAESKHSEVGKVAGILGFPLAGAYLNQTPFEQKVIAKYDEQNPPKGDTYSAKLKTDLKSAIASKDDKQIQSVKKDMKNEGMTESQISNAEKTYTKPFAEDAWKKLSAEDQKHLIGSASEEEKAKFKVKSE